MRAIATYIGCTKPFHNERCRTLPFMLAFVFAAVCLLCMPALSADCAYADDADDTQAAVNNAQATLDSAETKMTDIVSQYDSLQAQSDAIQAQIDSVLVQATQTQQAIIIGRQALGRAAVYEYRGGDQSTVIAMLLDSDNISQLVQNMQYLNCIMDDQAQQIEQQKQLNAQYDGLIEELNTQKDAQDAKLAEMQAARAEAQNVVSDAASKLQGAQDDQATRLAALTELAQSIASSSSDDGSVSENWNTIEHPADVENNSQIINDTSGVSDTPSNSGTTTSDSGSSSADSGSSGSGSADSGSSDIGWSTGIASAYGGSSDPYTPNPGTTATGAVCDDYSMGVAVPMSWSGYRSYFGRSVEIEYNGTTVIATVNDCGYMSGGARSLDLQPGVFKAFGFSDCYAWGIRTVNYRFL